jgi:ATP-dependent DNA helicase PIF1
MNLSVEQEYAFERFKCGENLFITGPGGTGKTKLIDTLVKYCVTNGKNVQVCAMTGCAALLLQCGAQTLHSWSGIKLAKGDNSKTVFAVSKSKRLRAKWRKVQVLIIDEVSMMSLKIFDLIEEIGRACRLSDQPFGGIQVIFTGDFYQLPPVGTFGDPATDMFCFESVKWNQVFPIHDQIQLKTIFRQTDPKYKEILLQVRNATLTEPNIKILQDQVKREIDPEKYNGCMPTKLFPTRAKTDFLNNSMFAKLPDKEIVFVCEKKTECKTILETGQALSSEKLIIGSKLTAQEIEYEFQTLLSTSTYQEILALKKGAVVMCTTNLDMENGICNGSQGIVTNIINTSTGPLPEVKFSNGFTRVIPVKYRQSDEYPTLAIGQIPLCLAWALTIHKIQGATLKMAEIDVGNTIFEYGQTYVALSRVQSLDGLYLSAFHSHRIKANPRVIAFYQRLPEIDYAIELAKIKAPTRNDTANLERFEYKEEIIDPTVKKIKL